MKRIFLILVTVILLISTTPCVFAASGNTGLGEVYRVLKAHGLSDVATAAIVGNVARESGGNPAAVEGGKYGVGIGVFQLGNDWNRQGLEDYCATEEHAQHEKVTLEPPKSPKAYTICNVVSCQVNKSVPDFKSTMNWRQWSSNYNQQVQELPLLATAVEEGRIPASISVTNSWKGFLDQQDLMAAVIQFMCDFETPSATSCMWVGINTYNDSEATQQAFIDSVTLRYNAAVSAYEKYASTPLVSLEKIAAEVPLIEVPVADEIVEEPVEEPEPELVKLGTKDVDIATAVYTSSEPEIIVETIPVDLSVYTQKDDSASMIRSAVMVASWAVMIGVGVWCVWSYKKSNILLRNDILMYIVEVVIELLCGSALLFCTSIG